MKTIVLSILCFLFICSDMLSQDFSVVNQITLGGNDMDYTAYGRKTNDGGYIIGGSSQSGISGDKTEPKRGSRDYWLVKLNADLSPAWQKTFGGTGINILEDVLQASDGSYYIIGTSDSPISGNKTVDTIGGGGDFWLIKLDIDGNILWQRVYGGTNSDIGNSIIEIDDTTLLLAGYSFSDSSGTKTENSRGLSDYWIMKIDTSGSVLWDKTYGGSGNDRLRDMIINSHGEIFLSGESNSNASGEKTESNYGYSNIWVLKLDAQGNIIWDKTIGSEGFNSRGRLSIDNNIVYVIASSEDFSSGTQTENTNGEYDIWVTRLDNNGNIIWDRMIGGSDRDIAVAAIISFDNNILISATSYSGVSGSKTEPSIGFGDYWVVCVDSLGAIQWQKTIGGTGIDIISNIIEVAQNRYLLVGYSTSSISGHKTDYNRGAEDYWIVEIAANTGLPERNSNFSLVYPNPATDVIYISSFCSNTTYSINDIVGNTVMPQEKLKDNTINISTLRKGMYFISLESTQGRVVRRFVVKE